MVPPPMREAIEASRRQCEETGQDPSGEYQALARAAVDAVDHKQSRSTTRPRRPAGKPVQLALFELTST